MPEQEQLELMIIWEIVQYLRLREQRIADRPGGTSSLIEIVRNLPGGAKIDSLVNAQTVQLHEALGGDHYEIGQAGSVGPNSIANGQFLQVWNNLEGQIDLNELAQQLHKVRDRGRMSASGTLEDDVALAELAKAETAAKQGDGPRVLGHLARAGEWVLRIAVDIGVPVAVKALETAIGS